MADRLILLRAKKIVEDYRITIEKDGKCAFTGGSLELPAISANGKTPKICYEATKTALITAVAIMIQSGKKPPESNPTRKRTKQVNIRLTPYEKILLTEAAFKNGFDDLSGFVRHVVIKRIRQNP
jgi:hypothetical protein